MFSVGRLDITEPALELDTGMATAGQGCTSAFQLDCHGPGSLGQSVPSAEHSAQTHSPGIATSCLTDTVLPSGSTGLLAQSPKEIPASYPVPAE